ncbi:unnamed protein product [Cylindrotheca closterium]|uniref:1-alkyl-2-acetylglycerophosphocholine esterase n=1 Tax=Cylindrotheca closterium TaxID=2856 RepID=A0AAD2FSG5_9STRA|nr:unnamed protein product [Cylindrotheca closterium]
MIWGGLRPILSHVIIDSWTLFGLGYVVVTKPSTGKAFLLVVIAALSVFFTGSSFTNRWSITFPMIPLLALQLVIRPIVYRSAQKNGQNRSLCGTYMVGLPSILLVLIAAALAVLFPAIELPLAFPSKYNVGVVDVFLPADIVYKTDAPGVHQDARKKTVDHVTVRILYPTLEEPNDPVYQLKPETAEHFCYETMKYGAPPPLRKYDWMLHNWRLAKLPATRNAPPTMSNNEQPFPIVAFSHGLGGNAEIYSYQTLSLAASGHVVVVVEHTDGSGPVVSRQDGTVLLRQTRVEEDWHNGDLENYRKTRRAMVEFRSQELLAAVNAMKAINEQNIPALESLGIDFVGKLNVDEIHYMGHSFGAATALYAGLQQRPTSILAHDPVSGWLPDQVRYTLYDLARVERAAANYSYYWVDDEELEKSAEYLGPSIHDIPTLILFSHEWHSQDWEGAQLLMDMSARNLLGNGSTKFQVQVIDGATHNEFSDTSMMTPTWLARATGLTGERPPMDTAWDVRKATWEFLKDLRVK